MNRPVTPGQPRGQLCIWTGVDSSHELDFNRWYDREHMQERVAIPGFQSARRFKSVDGGPRPYLALYYTDDLGVFTSAPYRQAFTQQTDWSLRNFARMRNTQRRVGRLALELGEGEGGALAMFAIAPDAIDVPALQARLSEVTLMDGVVRGSLLLTDAGLSTPLVAGATPAAADALLMIEATDAEVARAQALALAQELHLPGDSVSVFQSLWRLGA